MKKIFSWYGAIILFLLLALGTGYGHYQFLKVKTQNEAVAHNQEWSEKEFQEEWLSDTFENHQSEYAQLFLQTLIVIGLSNYLMKKQEDDIRQAVRKELDNEQSTR